MRQKTKVLIGTGLVLGALGIGGVLLVGQVEAQNRPLRVAYVVPGNLGDRGFLDSGNAGIERIKSELGAEVRVLQASPTDPQEWTRNMQAVSDGSYDLVVTGGSGAILEVAQRAAQQFPKQQYIYFAGEVSAPNVASIGYRYNEGSYLAGVFAALVTTDRRSFPLSRGNKTVGVIGGLDIPPINDFIAGYIQGVRSIDPSIRVLRAYAGSFADPNRGFSQAQAMYNQGADIVYAVAGGTGLGILRASSTARRYSIGVDTNQNGLFPGNTVASMVLEIGDSIFESAKAFREGKLESGKTTLYGVGNNGVSLVMDQRFVPNAVRQRVAQARQDIASGRVVVDDHTKLR